MGRGLQLSLVVFLQSERLAGSRVEELLPGHLPALHPHHLQHGESLHGRRQRQELEPGASLAEFHSWYVGMGGCIGGRKKRGFSHSVCMMTPYSCQSLYIYGGQLEETRQ